MVFRDDNSSYLTVTDDCPLQMTSRTGSVAKNAPNSLDHDIFRISSINDSPVLDPIDSIKILNIGSRKSENGDTSTQPIKIKGSPGKNYLETRFVGSYQDSEKASSISVGESSFHRTLGISKTSSHAQKWIKTNKPWHTEKQLTPAEIGARYLILIIGGNIFFPNTIWLRMKLIGNHFVRQLASRLQLIFFLRMNSYLNATKSIPILFHYLTLTLTSNQNKITRKSNRFFLNLYDKGYFNINVKACTRVSVGCGSCDRWNVYSVSGTADYF